MQTAIKKKPLLMWGEKCEGRGLMDSTSHEWPGIFKGRCIGGGGERTREWVNIPDVPFLSSSLRYKHFPPKNCSKFLAFCVYTSIMVRKKAVVANSCPPPPGPPPSSSQSGEEKK